MEMNLLQQPQTIIHKLQSRRYQLIGLFILILLWRFCLLALGLDPFSHDPQDSYTLQALAWRMGLLHLPENIPQLELAVYQGHTYVSFPPVPTLPIWLLTFFFGEYTPNRMVNLIYFLSSYLVGYSLCRRYQKSDLSAAGWSFFLVAGCNLLNICWFGGVWYQAQALSFLLTLCAFRLLLEAKPLLLSAGLCCLALAVGCRPFQAVYVPVALYLVYNQLQQCNKYSLPRSLFHLLLLCLLPLFIGVAYGLYNFARFDSFLEFGHTYLHEFQTYGPQFSLLYIKQNLQNILRLPFIQDGRLDFPRFYGFAFYLSNPLFLLTAVSLIRSITQKRMNMLDLLLVLSLLVHFFLLLLHRTFGGWQFGTRYLIDLCPVLFFLTIRHPEKTASSVYIVAAWGILFNLYGGLLHFLT